jgi:hypothetical protein
MNFHLDTVARMDAISTTRCGECSPQTQVLEHLHCLNSDEVRVVTFAQRRENDSL